MCARSVVPVLDLRFYRQMLCIGVLLLEVINNTELKGLLKNREKCL